MSLVSGYHHLTMSTDGAQEDFDFFTKDLGLHSVKRTVLFDGVLPVYHLYYGSKNGDASTIFTTFPFRKPGVFGRRGSNQSKIIQAAIPVGASDFWVERLNKRGNKARKTSRFGITRVALEHPCGIHFELVENPGDRREPITNDKQGIGKEQGIKGIYGVGISVTDRTSMDDFFTIAIPMKKLADNHEGLAFAVPENKGLTSVVEVLHEPSVPQGTWTLGRRHDPPYGPQHRQRGKPAEAARPYRGPGLHRHFRAEGPQLLQVLLRALARWRAVRDRLDRAGRLGQG